MHRPRVTHHLVAETLRVGHPGIVVDRRAFDVRVELWNLPQRSRGRCEVVFRHDALVAHIVVVKTQADLDPKRAAFAGAISKAEHFQHRLFQPAQPTEDRNCGPQRLHIMPRVLEQMIPLGERFLHQTELRLFEVA